MEFLLKEGWSPNEYKDDFAHDSYLQLASRCGNVDIITLLITYGAHVNHQDILGRSALHDAAIRNNLDSLKTLITAGADINLADKKGRKPIDDIKAEIVRKEIEEFVNKRDKTQNLDKGKNVQTLIKKLLFFKFSV